MANDDEITARGGLIPVQYPYGNYRRTLYQLTTGGAAANVYLGQPMDLDANGRVVPAGVGNATALIGPVLGFVDTNKAGLPTNLTDLDQASFLDGSVDAYCVVADDPDQLFQIQEDTGGTALTQTAIGNTVNLVPRSSSGSTVTGWSTFEADRSSVVATDSSQLQIVGLVDKMNSDGTANDFGNYAKLLVRINWHRYGGRINQAI